MGNGKWYNCSSTKHGDLNSTNEIHLAKTWKIRLIHGISAGAHYGSLEDTPMGPDSMKILAADELHHEVKAVFFFNLRQGWGRQGPVSSHQTSTEGPTQRHEHILP